MQLSKCFEYWKKYRQIYRQTYSSPILPLCFSLQISTFHFFAFGLLAALIATFPELLTAPCFGTLFALELGPAPEGFGFDAAEMVF